MTKARKITAYQHDTGKQPLPGDMRTYNNEDGKSCYYGHSRIVNPEIPDIYPRLAAQV